jgi:hypothetical protein
MYMRMYIYIIYICIYHTYLADAVAEEEGESAEKGKEDEKKALQLQLARRTEDLEKVSVFVLVALEKVSLFVLVY